MGLKASPLLPVVPETLALLPQAGQVHLGLQCHEEGARVGDLQIKPQTWTHRGTQTYYVSILKSLYIPNNTTQPHKK